MICNNKHHIVFIYALEKNGMLPCQELPVFCKAGCSESLMPWMPTDPNFKLNKPVSTCLIGSTWKHKRSLKNSWKQVPQGINTKKTTKQWHVELVLCLFVYGTTNFYLCNAGKLHLFQTSSWIAKSPASWMQCFLKQVSGWWYTYPSETYESQLGWWHA